MMELKNYQRNALDAFTHWLETLEKTKQDLQNMLDMIQQTQTNIPIPDQLRNYPRTTWQTLKANCEIPHPNIEYVDRTDEANRPIPHICFKVPTGGGKTLIAASALERVPWQRGLVLWIVPTKAIYAQTKAALWNKDHPYRKIIQRAAAGRVKMLEKEDIFNSDDIANYLCVMLLMLPATNRQRGREFLRMFRDTGRYPTFFPDSDNVFGDRYLLNQHTDLECHPETEGGHVKHSLFNVFKILRPVVVLDEAHKAYGTRSLEARQEFARSINRLDPRMVIELSATPNSGISNLLVDIHGTDLKREEMIKLPIQVTAFQNAEWQLTLGEAADELIRLDAEARAFQANTGRYIRPIAVVRVERTGRDQRDTEHIHAEDVREYLTQTLHVPAEAVRVKSAENDEIQNEDLLSEYSQVRWIITKSALMEGWDCPFAYLLVMLDNTQAQRAITQLVGRVMRQPHAQLTGIEPLDQSYVYCNNTEVGTVVEQVRNGLEKEGLTGLVDEISGTSGTQQEIEAIREVTVERRSQFQGEEIYLPMVLHKKDDDWIQLNYQAHILPNVNWAEIPPPDPNASAPQTPRRQTDSVDVEDTQSGNYQEQELHIEKVVSISDFAHRLSDIVPNMWQAARIAQEMYDHLIAGQTDEDIFDRRSYLVHVLREHVKNEVETQTEQIFHRKLDRGQIRFDLETREPNYRIVDSYEIEVHSDRLLNRNYQPVQLSLFEPIFDQQFENDDEKKFAYYLDEERAMRWWHRVAARQRGDYYVQGWKRGRIYPDFVAMTQNIGGITQVLICDTKGEHLSGNLDTEYKRKVLETLEGAFNTAGRMIVNDGVQAQGIFQLVFNEQERLEISARINSPS